MDFFPKLTGNCPKVFSPSFHAPKTSMPNPRHVRGPKSTPLLETFFSVVSLGARPWFASLLLDATISMLTNEDL